MTRGKYAIRADLRRYEAAQDHVDKLIGQLTEAKVRARQNEAAALELPGVRAELARVRQLAEAGSSDTLEKERTACNAALEAADDKLSRFLDLFATLMQRVHEDYGDIPYMTWDEWGQLRELTGSMGVISPSLTETRQKRRQDKAFSSAERLTAALLEGGAILGRDREELGGKIAERYGLVERRSDGVAAD